MPSTDPSADPSSRPFADLKPHLRFPASLVTEITDEHESYTHDATFFTNKPAAILRAECVEDIIAAVNFCREHGHPITTRGAGTGLSGGCVPSAGALLISTAKMTRFSIDVDTKTALCEPGVITKTLQDSAAEHGLTYPPDPASFAECTLGGNVAEGAGGLRCKRFGVTKDYVIGLEAVLADGRLLKTGCFNDYRGFSLGDLLIASEGTLAIITRIAVRLIHQVGRGDTILVAFDQPVDAARTVSQINAGGIIPTVMEFLDGDAAACSNEYEKTDGLDNVAAILLLETSDVDREGQTAQIRKLCEDNHCSYLCVQTDAAKADELWRVRRNLSYASKAVAELRISEDVAVPNDRFPVLVAFVADMNRNSSLRINSYGHAGDGNLHVNFMAEKDTPENRAEIDRQVEILMRKTLEMGGTLTGEHGIGLAKQPYLRLEFTPATLDTMRRVKDLLDISNLLNPDKLLPS